MTIADQWRAALADVVVRHPNRESRVMVEVTSDGQLVLKLDATRDSCDPERIMTPFVISCVQLTYFPGVELARQWLAAAFAGYVAHEALELVTVGDLETRPLDPHQAPFAFDRCLRVGLPVVLTPESLRASLELVMAPSDAKRLCEQADSA
jgi:hypothetical protein